MQVQIHDDPDNWLRWGNLVRGWVFNSALRPANTTDMQTQMAAAGVVGHIGGPPRAVTFTPFNYGSGPLIFPLPTTEMVTYDETELATIAAKPPGQRQYPLPSFYPIAFGGAAKVDLAPSVVLDFGRRRLGEYTILECQ
jgi:hypothetical protein